MGSTCLKLHVRKRHAQSICWVSACSFILDSKALERSVFSVSDRTQLLSASLKDPLHYHGLQTVDKEGQDWLGLERKA